MNLRCISIAIILLCSTTLTSQDIDFSVRKIDLPEGFLGLYASVQDSSGFIWIRNFHALIRYDGRTMEMPFGIAKGTEPITYGRPFLLENGIHNDIWVGSEYNGLCHIDLKTNHIRNWISNPDDPSTLGGNEVFGIAIDQDGTAWIGTDSLCLNALNPETGKFKRYYPTIQIPVDERFRPHMGQIELDPTDDDILWVASPYGVFEFSKSKESFDLLPFDTLHTFFYKPAPVALHVDLDGTIWSEQPNQLLQLNRDENRWIESPLTFEGSYQKGWVITDIEAYNKDVLAVTTARDGLYLFNRKTGHNQMLDRSTGVRHMNKQLGYSTFLPDRTGGFWTNNGERTIIRAYERKRSSRSVYFPSRTFNWQRAYLKKPSENTFYIGTLEGEGLIEYHFESKSHQYHRFQTSGLLGGDVFMDDLCFDAQFNVWIGSDVGLLKFDPNSKVIERVDTWANKDFQVNDFVRAVHRVNGNLWIGTQKNGLFALDLKSGLPTPWSVSSGGFCHGKEITDVVSDPSGNIWIGTTSGIIRFNPINEKQFELPDSLDQIDVVQFHFDSVRNEMWVGTFGQGMYRISLQNDQITHYLSRKDQVSNCIFEFILLEDGTPWINADGGTIELNPRTGEMITYSEFGVGRRGSLVQLDNGYIISGLKNGFHYYKREALTDRGLLPEVYFKSINIANREEAFTLAPDYIRSVVLNPGERELQIQFDARNFNPNAFTEFQYRLIGLDSNWIDLREKTFLNFNNLPADQYQLQLKAINAYGGESKIYKTLDIKVVPPFYQTSWFRILAIALLIAGIYLLYRWLMYRQHQLQIQDTIEYFSTSHYGENSVDEILWDVARNVISRLGFEDCVVYLADHDEKLLIQKAAFGPKNPTGQKISNRLVLPFNAGIVGAAATTGVTQRVRDTSLDHRYVKDDQQRRSELAVPILHEGEVLGVIDSEHRKRNYFSRKDADVIEQIAAHCAQKLARAQAAEEVRRAEQELMLVQKEVAESKLTALQAQMNPHFLYNSLNSINWYILKNRPQEASRYLTKFSKLVRLILDNSKNLTIPLKQELASLELYLELESMRFEDTFDYEIQTVLDDETEDIEIPPLILQPFVENAIWHGLMHKEGKGKLIVQLYPENGHLKCIVQDNGIGRDASHAMKKKNQHNHESKGMKLTNDRIRLLHKDFLSEEMIRVIDLKKADGSAAGTRVEVSLPIT